MEDDLGWLGGNANNDWDLDAVVRLGSGEPLLAPAPAPADDPFFAHLLEQQQPQQQHVLPDVGAPAPAPAAALFLPAPQVPPWLARNEELPQQQEPTQVELAELANSIGGGSSPSQPARRPRRSRKNSENKTVVTVPVRALASADEWAWRKYGQKPIKGSIYPRGYYRCSTNPECPARKHVDRSSSDPNSVVVTYTDEHNHELPHTRNVLAGTIRLRGEALPRQRRAARAEVVGAPSSSSSQAPPPPPVVSNEFDAEEDDDALAVKALIDSAAMAPENAFLFLKVADNNAPPPASVHHGGQMATMGIGGGGQMATMGTGGGGNYGGQLFPVPGEVGIGTHSGGTVNWAASGSSGRALPVHNVVVDTTFVSPWEQPAWDAAAAAMAASRRRM